MGRTGRRLRKLLSAFKPFSSVTSCLSCRQGKQDTQPAVPLSRTDKGFRSEPKAIKKETGLLRQGAELALQQTDCRLCLTKTDRLQNLAGQVTGLKAKLLATEDALASLPALESENKALAEENKVLHQQLSTCSSQTSSLLPPLPYAAFDPPDPWAASLTLETAHTLAQLGLRQKGTLPNGGCFLSSLAFFLPGILPDTTHSMPPAEQLHAAGATIRQAVCCALQAWAEGLSDAQMAQLYQDWAYEGAPWESIEHYIAAMCDETTWVDDRFVSIAAQLFSLHLIMVTAGGRVRHFPEGPTAMASVLASSDRVRTVFMVCETDTDRGHYEPLYSPGSSFAQAALGFYLPTSHPLSLQHIARQQAVSDATKAAADARAQLKHEGMADAQQSDKVACHHTAKVNEPERTSSSSSGSGFFIRALRRTLSGRVTDSPRRSARQGTDRYL